MSALLGLRPSASGDDQRLRHVGELEALGEERFKVTAPGHEGIGEGFDAAQRRADELAGRLG